MLGVLFSSFWGMESHLTIFFVILCGWKYMRLAKDSSDPSWIIFGLLLGGLILSRLDDVFVAMALILSATFATRFRTFAKRLFLAGAPCCFLVVPYLIFNKIIFGHPLPVSGAIKSCFPHLSGHLANIGPLGQLTGLFALGGIALSYVKPTSRQGTRLIRAFSFGVVAQLAYTISFTHDPSTKSFWYYATASLTCALIIDFAVESGANSLRTQKASQAFQVATLSLSFLIIACGTARAWLKLRGFNANPMNKIAVGRVLNGSNQRFELQLGAWITANLPPNARILTVDFPGRIAFFTNADVVPLDGLISDYKYNDEIVNKGIGEFIARTHIVYYIGPICDSATPCPYSYFSLTIPRPNQGDYVEVSSPLYRLPAGGFHLERKDLLLDVNQALGPTLGHGHLGVWRLEQQPSASPK